MDRRAGDDDHQIVDQSEILDGPTLVVDRSARSLHAHPHDAGCGRASSRNRSTKRIPAGLLRSRSRSPKPCLGPCEVPEWGDVGDNGGCKIDEGDIGAVDRPRRLKRRIWSNVGIAVGSSRRAPRGCTFPEASFQRMLRLRGIRQDRPSKLEAWSQTAPSLSSLCAISHSKRTDKRPSKMCGCGTRTSAGRREGRVAAHRPTSFIARS